MSETTAVRLQPIRPPAAPEDQPAPPSVSGVRSLLIHEWTLVLLAATILASVMTWPTLRHPIRAIPQDTYDPTLQAWQVAWAGHALLHDPLHLWSPNATYPEHLSLAFSDSLLGYAPTALLGSGPGAAVLRYNVLFVLTFALATSGMYALLRQLGSERAAAAVIAVAFAYAPWRFAHAGHLNILSTGAIPLALAMLARGHGYRLPSGRPSTRGERPRADVRPGWALASWLTAAWQLTLGFGLGLPFAYLLAGLVLVVTLGWLRRGRPAVPTRLWTADLIGMAAFAGIVVAMGIPYLRVLAEHPDARWSTAWLDLFSPPLRGFFVAGEHSWLWGSAQQGPRAGLGFAGEMELLPGFTLLALAGLGLVVSRWTIRTRAILLCGIAVSIWLALGTAAPAGGRFGYLLLYRFAPGFDGSRTPGRLALWTILLLCVLAAGTLNALASRHLAGRLLLALSLVLVLAEGVDRTPHEEVPTAPVALAGRPGPVLVLPTGELDDLHVMLWSTEGFPTIVNGSSGYNPPSRNALRKSVETFPDARSVRMLRALGVRTVVVLPSAENAKYLAGLRETHLQGRITPGAVVFTL